MFKDKQEVLRVYIILDKIQSLNKKSDRNVCYLFEALLGSGLDLFRNEFVTNVEYLPHALYL